jgi:hypothetical protein
LKFFSSFQIPNSSTLSSHILLPLPTFLSKRLRFSLSLITLSSLTMVERYNSSNLLLIRVYHHWLYNK